MEIHIRNSKLDEYKTVESKSLGGYDGIELQVNAKKKLPVKCIKITDLPVYQ